MTDAAVEGPMTAAWFLAYAEQVLAPTLEPGDVVILDNLAAHKGAAARQGIKSPGARLLFLRPTDDVTDRRSA